MSKGTVLFDIFWPERGFIMPRNARNIREGGYRHVIIRGIGKQILFEDENDNRCFIRLIEKYSKETGVSVCAYCLMDNHVHLLLHDIATDTALFMKKLGVSYSAYFNAKYERVGHLFQDRYKSQNINDERAYLSVLRYILRNPEKAGICRTEEYRWSSYSSYGEINSFLDQTLTWELLGSKESFTGFVGEENRDICMEYENRINDATAAELIENILGVKSGTALQQFERKERDRALRLLKEGGLSIRKIERLTGINRGVIQKA